MDPIRFDRLAVALAAGSSRRSATRALAAALGGLLVPLGTAEAARCKRPGRRCARARDCCSRDCRGRRCRCNDGERPCGGVCCGPTDGCQVDENRCVPHCVSGRFDRDESDVDCGGSCEQKCAIGQDCFADGDCESGICENGTCRRCREDGQCAGAAGAPFCVDNNCVECRTDTDCPLGKPHCQGVPAAVGVERVCVECLRDDECPPGHGCRALDGACAPRCEDGKTDGDESDVDCGGSVCEPCPNGRRCQFRNDCASGHCVSNRCRACTRDDQCAAGQRCVGGECGVGRACLAGVNACAVADPNTARCEAGGDTACFCVEIVDGGPVCVAGDINCGACNANVGPDGVCHPDQGEVCCPRGRTCVACPSCTGSGTGCARPCPNPIPG